MADGVRLSDIEPRFVCKALAASGALMLGHTSIRRGWGPPTEAAA
jgi:hypothetical protein